MCLCGFTIVTHVPTWWGCLIVQEPVFAWGQGDNSRNVPLTSVGRGAGSCLYVGDSSVSKTAQHCITSVTMTSFSPSRECP